MKTVSEIAKLTGLSAEHYRERLEILTEWQDEVKQKCIEAIEKEAITLYSYSKESPSFYQVPVVPLDLAIKIIENIGKEQ